MSLCSHTLVFRTHNSSKYSVAALIGAVEVDSRLSELDVKAPIKLSIRRLEAISNHSNVILAYSVMSTQRELVYNEVKEVRDHLGNDITIIGGGAHATARPRELLEMGFDYVAVGEGERVFPDFLKRIIDSEDPDNIDGIVSRDTEEIPKPSSLDRVNLNDYPPFAVDLNIVGPIEVTRGCPFRCNFCATPFLTGGKVRHRDVESVVYWLKRAVEERGFERTWFLSPNALCYGGRGRKTEQKKLQYLLDKSTSIEGLKEVYFGAFPSEVRPEFVTRSVLEMMKQYVANKTVQIGLQSGSDKVLKLANRHHTVEEGINAVNIALDVGFVPHVDMIFGLPGENNEDIQASLEICELILDMDAKIHAHVFMPLPGSEFENMPVGSLTRETRQILGEMARKGNLTGSWNHQVLLGKNLVENTNISKS
jgi:B12-binding domain/radical SAM domain protein